MMNKSIGMSVRENLRKRLLEGNHKKAVGVCIMAEDTKKVLLLTHYAQARDNGGNRYRC